MFLAGLWANVQEDVVFVFAHSGSLGALLEAAGGEPYPLQNAELVPVVIEHAKRECTCDLGATA